MTSTIPNNKMPFKDPEFAKKASEKGVAVRKQNQEKKKLFLEIYGNFLEKNHKFGKKKISGKELVESAIIRAVSSDNPVPILKEMREVMDGKSVEEKENAEMPVQIINNFWNGIEKEECQTLEGQIISESTTNS